MKVLTVKSLQRLSYDVIEPDIFKMSLTRFQDFSYQNYDCFIGIGFIHRNQNPISHSVKANDIFAKSPPYVFTMSLKPYYQCKFMDTLQGNH